jgi:uncharacterized protein (TIGR03118 family)
MRTGFSRLLRLAAMTAIVTASVSSAVSADPLGYFQVNLTSDIQGLAQNFDPNLKNPWGMSYSATSPFWVSDQVTNVSTLYNAFGVPNALVVATPPTPGPGPTGQVFVGGQGFNLKNGGGAANFVFATLAGTIDGWNNAQGTSAVVQASTPGAVYTGLAVVGNNLYAADSEGGKIDVFNNAFNPTAVSGSFIDPNVPAGFTPYNIQNIDGKLYVEYALEDQPGGYIGIFDANGNFLQHISDSHLDSPWGITLAPLAFGQFGGALLIGNEGNGMINAFDPITGMFLGTLSDASGNPIVNEGLWAIGFRAAGSTFDPSALYFVAGINDEADGLFGAIKPVPEPSTLALLGLGSLALGAIRRRTARAAGA